MHLLETLVFWCILCTF